MWLLLFLALVLAGAARDAGAATIFVTVLDQRPISAGPGCSLQEAIYSSVLHDTLDGTHGIAIEATDPDHFITTQCVRGTGDDTIVLPTGGTLTFDAIVDGDAYNPYGPTATPLVSSTITIEGHGATLVGDGTTSKPGKAGRLFAVGPASITTPNGTASGTGDLTLRHVFVKHFTAKGGAGGSAAGGGMGAGGVAYVQYGHLTIQNSTFLSDAALGGNGGDVVRPPNLVAPNGFGGRGGGGGLGGDGGTADGSQAGAGGGGARGNGGNGYFGGGGGGGTVFSGGIANVGGPGGYLCGGNGSGSLSGTDGYNGKCPGGGGGGAGLSDDAVQGGHGGYGGGGGGAKDQGGDGGFGGGGGGSINNPEDPFSGGDQKGGNGGFGGGGGAGFGSEGHGGAFGGDALGLRGGGGAGLGGVVFNDDGVVSIRNSTFVGNHAGAGRGINAAHDGTSAGGAIFSRDGSLTVVGSTFDDNSSGGIVGTGASGGDGIVVFSDGSGVFNLDDTIVADRAVNDCYVRGNVIAAGGGNLIRQNGTGGAFDTCPGVAVTDDPQLGPLALNVPGDTPTQEIPFGSPAMSAAVPLRGLATDQRGVPRPQADGWDIGAYEVCRRQLGPSVEPAPCVVTTNPGPTHTLTIAISSDTGGSTNFGTGAHDVPADSVIVVTATPNDGYIFVGWDGNVTDPTKPTTTVVMDQAQTVMANFAPDDEGFVPPDKATAACEDGVARALAKLSNALVGCEVSAAAGASKGKTFDEEGCEQRVRAKYDAGVAKLKGCPACLDAAARGALADQVAAELEQRGGEIYCAGTVAIGGDNDGLVPPDKITRKCEDGAAKRFAKLVACVGRCHVKGADEARKGKAFDEEACEEKDAKKSCRAKYDAAGARLLATAGACPDCLGSVQQAALAEEAERSVDAVRGNVFCAGTHGMAR